MKKGGVGGEATLSGLRFEEKTDVLTLLSRMDGYEVRDVRGKAGKEVLFKRRLVARCFRKRALYDYLKEEGIDWKLEKRLSCRLFPDDAILVVDRKTLFIIEVKHQNVDGSTDEKLQTCDFKRRQYRKLVDGLGLTVEYVYVLNDWFNKPKYRDVLEYVRSVKCHYRFNELPLDWLGLPASDTAG